jgi:hypothetical protein
LHAYIDTARVWQQARYLDGQKVRVLSRRKLSSLQLTVPLAHVMASSERISIAKYFMPRKASPARVVAYFFARWLFCRSPATGARTNLCSAISRQ